MLNQFIEKIINKEVIIGIVGLDYVGLPLMLRFAEVGYRVVGIDVDESKNEMLNAGKSYIKHIPSKQIAKHQHLIHATSDFSQAREADALILCVPTPLNKYREPDLSYVIETTDALLPFPKMREHHFDLSSVDLTPQSLAQFDCVILATQHKSFDYDLSTKHANLVIDTRGGFRAYQHQTNIVSA
ncbi:MAG: hypothetical protein EBQ95_00815 [Gammaproteobacteria bacterium]|nr:hypothetical protein [Gammaproteobacteria bacterium]